MLKSFLSRDIIYKQRSNCTSIIRSSNGSKILLACSVPDLKFNIFVFNTYSLCSKFDSYGDIMGCPCLILDELQNNTWLTYSSVANDYEFEQIVVRIHWWFDNNIMTFYLICINIHKLYLHLYRSSLNSYKYIFFQWLLLFPNFALNFLSYLCFIYNTSLNYWEVTKFFNLLYTMS